MRLELEKFASVDRFRIRVNVISASEVRCSTVSFKLFQYGLLSCLCLKFRIVQRLLYECNEYLGGARNLL